MALWKDEGGASPPEGNADSFLGAGLIIEGKIQGTGHVRVRGNVKGNIHVQGDLAIEPGAHIAGEVRADTVRLGGEVQGNVHVGHAELLESGTLIGDLKASSLAVAAGSKMRGKVEFGWNEVDVSGREVEAAAS